MHSLFLPTYFLSVKNIKDHFYLFFTQDRNVLLKYVLSICLLFFECIFWNEAGNIPVHFLLFLLYMLEMSRRLYFGGSVPFN